jgi:hypothetical protein
VPIPARIVKKAAGERGAIAASTIGNYRLSLPRACRRLFSEPLRARGAALLTPSGVAAAARC